jgi:S-formylglutathione hydrolase FrmB
MHARLRSMLRPRRVTFCWLAAALAAVYWADVAVAMQWIATNFYSAALNRNATYEILLPDGYGPSNRVPVLYLLHGRGDYAHTWRVEAAGIITNALRNRHVALVFPDGDNSWYQGNYWRRYISTDLTHHIEQAWQVTNRRGIGGYDMGGYGALYVASIGEAYDHVAYRSASSMSGSFVEPNVPQNLGDLGGPILGRNDLADAVASRDFILLFDCGNEDTGTLYGMPSYNLASKNDALRAALINRGRTLWRNLFYYRPTGAHTWEYWRSRIPTHIAFHDNALNAPDVAITSHPAHVTIAVVTNQIRLAGTATSSSGVSNVTWQANGANIATSGVAVGSAAWYADVPLVATGDVVIMATAFSNYGYSNWSWITIAYSDTPTVVVTSHPGGAAAVVTSEIVRVAGTATASSGVAQVRWSVTAQNFASNGVAIGTEEWVADVPMKLGDNKVKITALSQLGFIGTVEKKFTRRATTFRIRTVRARARNVYAKTSDITYSNPDALTNGPLEGFFQLDGYVYTLTNAAFWKRGGKFNATYTLPKSKYLRGFIRINGNPKGDTTIVNLNVPAKFPDPQPTLSNFFDYIRIGTNVPLELQFGGFSASTNLVLEIRGKKQPWGLFKWNGRWFD